jgi:hypothetical protein
VTDSARGLPAKLLPLVIVPYLGATQLAVLDESEISGIHLCAKGVLLSPDYRIWQTGRPNHFKDSRAIQNPFTGDSSVFARRFLL